MKLFLKAALLLAVVVFMAGCTGQKALLPQEEAAKPQTELAGAVYIDSTLSMQGFVNFPTDSEYAAALKIIDQAANVGWSQSTFSWYRYGETVEPLNREGFLSAATPAFYKANDTKLQQVVTGLDPQKLNILVTDLFQTDQDIQAIVSALKDKFRDSRTALGILGMRSHFNGYVYDIGTSGARYYYDSGMDKNRYKPFYFLVLGPQAEVEQFLKLYQQALPENLERHLVLFEGSQLPKGRVEASKHLQLAAGEQTYPATISILPWQAPYPQFLLRSYPGVLNFAVYGAPGQQWQEQLSAEELACSTSQLEKWSGSAFEPVDSESFARGTVQQAAQQGQELCCDVQLQLQPAALPKGDGVYRLRLEVNPAAAAYRKLQGGLDEWDMDVSNLSAWQNGQFPGWQTFNLSKFMDALTAVAYTKMKPALASTWIYMRT